MAQHLRSLNDVTASEFNQIVDLALRLKADRTLHRTGLAGKSIAVVFSKQSTRTRVSFEVGAFQLGAQPVILTSGGKVGMQMGRGETISDTANTLSCYVDAIVMRTDAQSIIDGLAEFGSVPVINALTDLYHPCQALADIMTMRETFGDIKGRTLVYAGAGNNVAHSLMLAGPKAGVNIVVACPASVPPDAEVLKRAQADAAEAGTTVTVQHDLAAAVEGASAVYADTWVSMGEEEEAARLRAELADYTVTTEIMAKASDDAIFMHCLPAHRGEEVTAEVIDGPQSVVFTEAENRLHAQKALLLLLLGGEEWA